MFDIKRGVKIVDGDTGTGYPDFVDAQASEAYWRDTKENLTEEELDALNWLHNDLVYKWASEEGMGVGIDY